MGTIGDWNLDGLPTDPLSIQNGILVSARSPFFVYIYLFGNSSRVSTVDYLEFLSPGRGFRALSFVRNKEYRAYTGAKWRIFRELVNPRTLEHQL